MNNLPARIGELVGSLKDGFTNMLRNERGEVVIPFLDSVDESQRASVSQFVTNSGATSEDIANYKSFDEFLSGYKPKPQSAPDWTSNLSPEQKSILGVKGWKSPTDILTGYSELEKLVGHEKIAMPKKLKDGSYDPEDMSRVMLQLGMPKDATGYSMPKDFKLPEGMQLDDKYMKEFSERAHKAGLLPAHYGFVMQELAQVVNLGTQAIKEANDKAHQEADLNLRAKWGLGYEERVKLANNILRSMGKDKGAEIVKKYGNDPLIIELMAEVGGHLSEETISQANMAGMMLTPESAKAEISRIRETRSKELNDASHPEHTYWVNKLNEYYKMIG